MPDFLGAHAAGIAPNAIPEKGGMKLKRKARQGYSILVTAAKPDGEAWRGVGVSPGKYPDGSADLAIGLAYRMEN